MQPDGTIIRKLDYVASHLGEMVGWMRQYTENSKREMDFADASLYRLAIATGVTDILTVDIADFSRYRLPNGQAYSGLVRPTIWRAQKKLATSH